MKVLRLLHHLRVYHRLRNKKNLKLDQRKRIRLNPLTRSKMEI